MSVSTASLLVTWYRAQDLQIMVKVLREQGSEFKEPTRRKDLAAAAIATELDRPPSLREAKERFGDAITDTFVAK